MQRQLTIAFLLLLLASRITLNAATKDKYNDSSPNRISRIKKYIVQYDSTYMKPIDSKFVIMLSNPNWMDYYEYSLNNGTKINFKSDLAYNAGIGLGYKHTLIYTTFNVSNMLSDSRTRNTEFDFNIVNNLLSFELYSFANKGKTNITSIEQNGALTNMNLPFDGLKINSLELDLNYYFNHKRYSNVAAYSTGHNALQVRSTGSFITGLTFMHQKVSLDLTSAQTKDFDFSNTGILQTAYNNYLVNAGYGYNYMINPKLMANLTVISGVGLRVNTATPTTDQISTNLCMSYKAKIALTYTNRAFFCGLNCQNYSNRNFDTTYSLNNTLGLFTIFLGRRF